MFLWIESQHAATIALIVFGFCYAMALATYIGAAIISSRRLAADLKATTPVMLTPLSVIVGLLIAFLASRVWSNLDHATADITQEATAIGSTVLIADALPAAPRASLRNAMKTYLQFVESDDWPAMVEGRASLRKIPPGLADALTTLLTFVPSNAGEQLAQQRAVQAVEQALAARRSRILLSQAVISPVQWIVILVLTELILVIIAMVHIDRRATVAANLFILSTGVAACLVLLMVNDRPFSAGGFRLEPIALRQVGVID